MSDQGLPADQINTGKPHSARVYDYWLGGHDNYEVDRDAAEQVLVELPRIREAVRENRAFVRRAVRTVVGLGVDQIIDIGTGIPTSPNTHEVAQAVAPHARVVYIDNDPIVAVHAQARLTGTGNTAFAHADVRDTRALLDHPAVNSLIDFGRPVAVLLVSVLHFVADGDDPVRIIATLRDAMAPGSYLIVSHGARETGPYDTSQTERIYRDSGNTLALRTHARVLDLLDGFELLEPGLVAVDEWRPDMDRPATAARYGIHAAVGRRP